MACATCQDFGRDSTLRGISIADVDLTATAGCPYCTLIKQCLYGMFCIKDILEFTICLAPYPYGLVPLQIVSLRKNYRPRDPRVGIGHAANIEQMMFPNSLGISNISFWKNAKNTSRRCKYQEGT